jgi:hypothetical protein
LLDKVFASINLEQRAVVKYNSSSFAIGAILLQEDLNSNLYIVVYLLRKFLPYKANYPIYNKELLAIIFCL